MHSTARKSTIGANIAPVLWRLRNARGILAPRYGAAVSVNADKQGRGKARRTAARLFGVRHFEISRYVRNLQIPDMAEKPTDFRMKRRGSRSDK